MQGDSDKKKSFTKRNSNKKVFLVWDRQSIRAFELAKHIGADLYLLYTSPIKHPVLFVKTLQILIKKRPDIIICQSPPITCSMIANVYKYIFAGLKKPKIVIDIHTGAITKPWSKNVSRLIMRSASCNIVTNKELQKYVIQEYGVNPIILEDPIPDFSEKLSTIKNKVGYEILQKDTFNIAVVSSFADDEPLQVVLEAASQLPDIQFHMTGDKTKINKKLLVHKSDNVTMTGLIDYDEYLDLLQKVDAIIDLTTDDKTMLSGAYEAVALEQPLIISDWMPLRRYFNKGTVYVNNSAEDIRDAITLVRTKKQELSRQMHQLKLEKIKDWDEKISSLYYLFH